MSKVNIETARILSSRGLSKGGLAQRFFTSTMRRHMDKYVKKDTGVLKNTAVESVDSITFVTPYAHRQYTTDNTREGKPVRGPYWDKRCWAAEGETITKEVARFVGGRPK